MDQYEIISAMNSDTKVMYFGSMLAKDVLKAYETAFGSPQPLAYVRDLLLCIVRCYELADNETQKLFCSSLKGI